MACGAGGIPLPPDAPPLLQVHTERRAFTNTLLVIRHVSNPSARRGHSFSQAFRSIPADDQRDERQPRPRLLATVTLADQAAKAGRALVDPVAGRFLGPGDVRGLRAGADAG